MAIRLPIRSSKAVIIGSTLLIAGSALTLSIGLLTRVAVVHPALLAAILLSMLIIAICILGYNWQVREIGTVASIEERKAELQPHLKLLNQLLVESRSRLRLSEEQLGNDFGRLSRGAMISLVAARRIIVALDGRLETFVKLLGEGSAESLATARELRGEPLQFGKDATQGIDAVSVPDLWAEQWAETLDSLFTRVEQDSKVTRRTAQL